MTQLTYNATPAVVTLGMIAELLTTNVIDSYLVQAATPMIKFGVAVTYGTAAGTVKPVGNVTDKFVGVAVFAQELNVNGTNGSTGAAYLAYEQLPIMHKGRIWVEAGEALALGDPLFVEVTNGVQWFNDSATSTRLPVNGSVRTAASAPGALVEIELW
jgi:hypothetical protein